MNSETKTLNSDTAVEAWVKPEIVSFEPVSATENATSNPGDNFSSNS
jgi:hypothetical protein